MTHWAHAFATALYLFAAVLGASGRSKRSSWWIALGTLVHTLGFYGLHLETPPVPLESFPAAISLIAWMLAIAYLICLAFTEVRVAAHWVAALAGLFTLVSAAGLAWSSPPQENGEFSFWSHAHVLLSAGGFSLLALASLSGLGYLVKERVLRHKRSGSVTLPSLESLDRAEHWTLAGGFVLLTLGVVTGFAWGIGHGMNPWTGHSLFLLAAWTVYLGPVGLRLVRQQHGTGPARGVVVGFAFLAFSYIGIRLLGVAA